MVISPEGNPELRAVARRWLRAAPPPSAEWEYADARQPSSNLDDLTLDVGGRTVALGEIIVQTQPAGSRLGVVMHHDVLSPLAEQDRQQIAFLALDNAVGEDVVETWLGTIEVSTEPPDQGVPLGKLADLVAAHRAAHLNEDGSPTWQLLQGDGPKGPLLALALVPLYPTIAAQHDNHVMVTVPYVDRTDHGFPSEPALEALRSFEDHLSNRLGGSGTLVASETSAGVRTLHYYVDSTSSGAEVVAGAVTGWPDGTVRVVTAHDPGWQAVRHLA
ncbi:MAG TPA: DUF695 domain-containing protein [Nocardioides bacterium]|nr:DUF695 domain-containing protein [Nocardioides sp.]